MTKVEKPRESKIIASAYTAFLFSFTLVFFAPSSIFFPNRLEFSSTYFEIIIYLILTAAGMIILLMVSLNLLPERMFPRGVSLMVALSLLLWLQGNILKWNYGIFDGRDILWDGKIWCGVIDTTVWCLFLGIALFKPAIFHNRLRNITYALILIQVISLGYTVSRAPQAEGRLFLKIDTRPKYTFSANKNVIILVLDTFQTDVFQEIINEDESIKRVFRDFVYFRNSLGGYPTTWPSVPLILTGRYYINSRPLSEFKKEVHLPTGNLLSLIQSVW